ncbi:MAG: hypothetical protein HY651_03540 [Acidobacteria bacterium]|nr:hypothetical protein [Acidobacteriota bacterium]
MLDKNSKEYWEEVSRLSKLLEEWDTDRNSDEIPREAMEAMQNLGLIVPMKEE